MIKELPVNNLLIPSDGSLLLTAPVRVLDLNIRSKSMLVINIQPPLRKPWVMNVDDALDEIESNLLRCTIATPEPHMLKREEEISDAERRTREQCWSLIKELVEGRSTGDLFIGGVFGSVIAGHASKKGTTRKRVYDLLYKYWAGGHSQNAFLWRTTNWGNPGKKKVYREGVFPGPVPKFRGVASPDKPLFIKKRDMVCMDTAFQRYVRRNESSMRNAWNWMLGKFYRAVSSEGVLGDLVRGSYPSLPQFKYYAKTHFDKADVLRGRAGPIRWEKDCRPLKGTAIDDLSGPGQRYEIDATIADVFLVHRVNRNWLIGRPVLYVVVDAYSRMIVGIHVGLEGPSWEGARHALYNAFTPKVAFCKRYGLEITEDEWPCHHIPNEISADRGEMLSGAGELLSATLDIKIKIAPPYRPDWKSIVESRFRLINEGLNLKFLPGGVDARRLERGDRDYELDALLDIDQFTNMVLEQVLNHNRNLHLPHLATKQMIADEIEINPISVWNWGIESSIVRLRTRSESEIKLSLLPSTEATVRRKGILFQGIYYSCALAEEKNWAAISHNARMQRVRVWYDPNSVDNVWIKQGSDFLPLEMLPYQKDNYSGFRTEEVIDRIAAMSKRSPDENYRALNDAVKVRANSEAKLNEAKEMKAKLPPPESKAEFKSDKRTKRNSELEVERMADVVQLAEIHSGAQAQPSEVLASEKSHARAPSPRKAAFLQLVADSLKREI